MAGSLTLGTYVPSFVPEAPSDPYPIVPTREAVESVADVPLGSERLLSLSQMAIPTIVALFLCAATFRWQAFAGTPYLDFWETLL
jgi:hypothetical protein